VGLPIHFPDSTEKREALGWEQSRQAAARKAQGFSPFLFTHSLPLNRSIRQGGREQSRQRQAKNRGFLSSLLTLLSHSGNRRQLYCAADKAQWQAR